ncbi:MAG: DUF4186 domain-containing protein [Planctomycetota bacterium]|jgi:hypothetical protein
MRDMDELFAALTRSKFRSKFRLSDRDAAYLSQKGLETIAEHARDFVAKRLADAYPVNDGRQTPTKNHPAFAAQHATGTCCRKCLEKWHQIPRGKPLSETDIDYIIEVLRRWLAGQNVEPPAGGREEPC